MPLNFDSGSVAERLEEQRERRGMLQREFAELLGFTKSYYAQVVTGHKPMSSRFAAMAAQALNVPIDWLLTGEGAAPGPGQALPPVAEEEERYEVRCQPCRYGRLVAQIREKLGATREDLAKVTGLDERTIENVESGSQKLGPSAEQALVKWAVAAGQQRCDRQLRDGILLAHRWTADAESWASFVALAQLVGDRPENVLADAVLKKLKQGGAKNDIG